MANSRYEYTRSFERPDPLLQNTWIVVRIDGRSFHRLSSYYKFQKPNDARAIRLANAAATAVLRAVPDIVFAYGQSDEYSFVLDRHTTLFERRESKLVSTVVSCFTAHYCFLWDRYFGESRTEAGTESAEPSDQPEAVRLNAGPEDDDDVGNESRGGGLPTFDGRAVCFPTTRNLRDYLSWRQADCHINNLYNTTFWAMVLQGGMSNAAAEEELKGSLAADKNEILFSRFGINYNNEPEMFKKGNLVYRDFGVIEDILPTSDTDQATAEEPGQPAALSKTQQQKQKRRRQKATIRVEHVDLIKDDFWQRRPWILGSS